MCGVREYVDIEGHNETTLANDGIAGGDVYNATIAPLSSLRTIQVDIHVPSLSSAQSCNQMAP